MYEEYLEWFKNQWHCLPNEKYEGINFIDKMLALRKNPVMQNNKNFQEKVEILTFEEYKKINGV